MEIEFVTGLAVVAPHPDDSRRLYVDALGLPLAGAQGYLHSERVPGLRHFGIWPLEQAAQACFGSSEWPAQLRVPQLSIEFELADPPAVHAAAEELRATGWELLHPAREEPWGQTVARLLSPEGAIVGVSHVPSMHP